MNATPKSSDALKRKVQAGLDFGKFKRTKMAVQKIHKSGAPLGTVQVLLPKQFNCL
jgi:hypothetical protein